MNSDKEHDFHLQRSRAVVQMHRRTFWDDHRKKSVNNINQAQRDLQTAENALMF